MGRTSASNVMSSATTTSEKPATSNKKNGSVHGKIRSGGFRSGRAVGLYCSRSQTLPQRLLFNTPLMQGTSLDVVADSWVARAGLHVRRKPRAFTCTSLQRRPSDYRSWRELSWPPNRISTPSATTSKISVTGRPFAMGSGRPRLS